MRGTGQHAIASKPDIPAAIALGIIHVGALFALLPALFSWSAVGIVVFLWWLTGGVGITLGFHRMLTHRGLRVPRPVEYAIAVLGTLALQGGPIEWISTHRKHHRFSDRKAIHIASSTASLGRTSSGSIARIRPA